MLASCKENYDKPRKHIKKWRHHSVYKGPYTQTMVFLVIMYRCERWTIKKAEHQRIDTFELWCWRRLLRVPWTARRSNVYTKGDQVWVFIGRTDVEVKAPIFWPPDAKN